MEIKALLCCSPAQGGWQDSSGSSQTQLRVSTVVRTTRLSFSLHQQLLSSPRIFYTNAAHLNVHLIMASSELIGSVKNGGVFCQVSQHLFNFSSRVNLQSSTVVGALKLCIIHGPPFDRQDRLLASSFFLPNFSFF